MKTKPRGLTFLFVTILLFSLSFTGLAIWEQRLIRLEKDQYRQELFLQARLQANGLLRALPYLSWKAPTTDWTCKQQNQRELCLKSLKATSPTLPEYQFALGRVSALFQAGLPPVSLYQIFAYKASGKNKLINLFALHQSWIDFCPEKGSGCILE